MAENADAANAAEKGCFALSFFRAYPARCDVGALSLTYQIFPAQGLGVA
jgi:hypothetical protein